MLAADFAPVTAQASGREKEKLVGVDRAASGASQLNTMIVEPGMEKVMPAMPPRKILAKEWLTLIVGLILGSIVMPAIFGIFDGDGIFSLYAEFYQLLFDKDDWWFAILLSLIPYFIFQFCRSIYFAYKIVNNDE